MSVFACRAWVAGRNRFLKHYLKCAEVYFFSNGEFKSLNTAIALPRLFFANPVAIRYRKFRRRSPHKRLLASALLCSTSGRARPASMATYQALVAIRFSRTDKNEAEHMALELMGRAGYDPRAAVTLWQKIINV